MMTVQRGDMMMIHNDVYKVLRVDGAEVTLRNIKTGAKIVITLDDDEEDDRP